MRNEEELGNQLGIWGEKIAEKYLRKKHYEILDRNFRCKYGELDIIAQKSDVVVFVEVKTRRSLSYGLPCEAVTGEKLHHLKKAANCYLKSHINQKRIANLDFRIDVVEILKIGEKTYVRHTENIF